MKQFLMASAAVFTIMAAAPASAAIVGSLATNPTANLLTLSSTGLRNGTGVTAPVVATLTGGAVYTSDQPFADQPAGSIFGNNFLASGPSSGMGVPATLAFTTATNFLSFLWGSPDGYNFLTINSTTGAQTFTAASLGFPVINGTQSVSQYVRFQGTGSTLITSVTFSNTAVADAFESANFSVSAPVPEPATWAMMLVGFGGIGFAMRRRKSKVSTTVRFA